MAVARGVACMVVTMAVSLLPLARPDVAGAAIVPPQNPPANVVPPPGYSGPCGSVAQPDPACPAGLATIDGDRQVEGLGPITLPNDYSSLTAQQQVFVLTNLERVDRGIAPVAGLAGALDVRAQAGAAGGRDPSFPPYGSGGGATYSSAPTVESMLLWMYEDGFGGVNSACRSPGAPLCWAHRDIILGSYAAPLLMGAGSGPGTTQLFVGGDTVDAPYFTWSTVAQNLPVGVSAPPVSALPGTAGAGSVQLWASGQNMSVSVSLIGGQGAFQLQSGGCNLAAGSSCTVPVLFTPPSIGAFDATLVVRGPNGTQNVPLRGISSHGYHLVASDGGIFSFGDAGFYGSTGSLRLNRPIVGMAKTHDAKGYWLVASDGGIFNYGTAQFHGSMGGRPLDAPIVGLAPTPDGNGYWEVATDGGIFGFGDAAFYGSRGGQPLNKPIVGMAPSATGHGYWLVASDGGIFTYGDASFHGSAGSLPLNEPVVGMAATSGRWRLLAGGDGRRDLRLRGRRLLRLHRWPAPERAHRRHGGHPGRWRLLAGGVRRRHLQLRGRRLLRLHGGAAAQPTGRRGRFLGLRAEPRRSRSGWAWARESATAVTLPGIWTVRTSRPRRRRSGVVPTGRAVAVSLVRGGPEQARAPRGGGCAQRVHRQPSRPDSLLSQPNHK